MEAAEKRIADAEDEIANLEARMADPALYQNPEEARQVAQRHAELQAGMDALYEDWEELSEIAGGSEGGSAAGQSCRD